jgi:hypothetical protein
MRVTVEDATGGRVVIDGDEIAKSEPDPESWDGETVAGRVIKAEDERRFTLCVGYPANRADRAIAADGHRDFASPEAVEKAAWNYMLKSRRVGLWHSAGDDTEGAGDVVESYVYRGPDWHLVAADGSEQVIKAGDWLIGIQWTPEIWANLIKTGKVTGISMQGSAMRRTPTAESLAALRD